MNNYDMCDEFVSLCQEAYQIVTDAGHKTQLQSWITTIEGEMKFPLPEIRLPTQVVGDVFVTVLATSPDNFSLRNFEEFRNGVFDPVWTVYVPKFIPVEGVKEYLQGYFEQL